MKFTGKIKDISIDYNNSKPIISVIVNENGDKIINTYKDEDKLSFEIKKFRQKRSLDANAYLWVLCDEIAKTIRGTKEEVYQQAVKDVGVFEFVLLIEKAVDRFIENWNEKGLGWFAEKLDNSKIDGCVKVMVYYGSSTYNTKEMSRLIDYIVDEAEGLGIATKTPDEIANLKSLWKVRE